MRVYSHFSVNTLSNTYLVALRSRTAILIDPSSFDAELLELIEHHRYDVCCILLTHADDHHLQGLHAIKRVYTGTEIFSAVPRVLDYPATRVAAGESIAVGEKSISTIGLPGHGSDRIAFLIGGFLFCGPALSAGELGTVSNPYAKAILLANIADTVFALPDETVILPYYGPPTTVGVERVTLPTEDPTELSGLS